MGFDTLTFWIIFAAVFVIFHIIRSYQLQNIFLLITSYLFYASWDYRFLAIIFISTITDYLAGFFVSKKNGRLARAIGLSASLTVNIGLLCLFKYIIPNIDTENSLIPPWIISVGIPIGISFYTFQTLSYTLDVYRGRIKTEKNFIHFAIYVCFFPQLMAGPIEKARNLLPQINAQRKIKLQEIKEGLLLIILGLFKKIYVASSLAIAVDYVFLTKQETPGGLHILAPIFMTFQVYCDFSGYSNMARGMARLLGFKLKVNFKPFFLSTSPQMFWRSWHLSFTHWIRDYLILPFRDPKKREWHLQVQIVFTLMIIGIWHKLSMNWALFGITHALFILVSRNIDQNISLSSKLRQPILRLPLQIIFMLTLYFLSGLLHRSFDLNQVQYFISQSLSFDILNTSTMEYFLYGMKCLAPLLIYEMFHIFKDDEFFLLKMPVLIQACIFSIFISFIIFFERVNNTGFIYFNF